MSRDIKTENTLRKRIEHLLYALQRISTKRDADDMGMIAREALEMDAESKLTRGHRK